MLARRIEAAGIPTVVVTMMPATAVELLAPRVVGVEFPFGHPFGMPGDRRMQRIALLTSAGFYIDGEQPPFDAAREKAEPTWGDPTHRVLPHPLDPRALGMMHLHINHEDPLADPEIALPLGGLATLVDEGRVGSVASRHVSVMGYQQAGLDVWRRETAPAIVELLRDEGTDGLILAPV